MNNDNNIDGRSIAASVKEELKTRVEALGKVVVTGVIVGDNDADMVYARMREKHASSVGIEARIVRLPADVSEQFLLSTIFKLNGDADVHGIIIHYPLPSHIDPGVVASSVSPSKDVDGLHPQNMGRLFKGNERMPPATPAAAVHILEAEGVELEGKEVVIANHSPVVGKPLAIMLLNRNATVHICHEFTKDLKHWTKNADVIVTAAGVPGLITEDMIKPGATIIDVSMNRVDNELCGDVDYDNIIKKAKVTPVPGGVGPVTNAMLLRNVIRAAESNVSK